MRALLWRREVKEQKCRELFCLSVAISVRYNRFMISVCLEHYSREESFGINPQKGNVPHRNKQRDFRCYFA